MFPSFEQGHDNAFMSSLTPFVWPQPVSFAMPFVVVSLATSPIPKKEGTSLQSRAIFFIGGFDSLKGFLD